MYFIPKEEFPFKTKKVTYPKILCDIRLNKAETHQTRITIGGNLHPFSSLKGFVCYDTGMFESLHSFDYFHIYKAVIVDYVKPVIFVDDFLCYF